MVSTVEVPDRGLFTSAILPPHSLNLPPISLRRVRTRLYFILFCYQNVDTYVDGSGPGSVGRLHFLFVCMVSVFFVVFSQVVAPSPIFAVSCKNDSREMAKGW